MDIKEDITDVNEVVMLSWTKHQVVKCLGCETYGFRRPYKDTEDFYVDGEEMIPTSRGDLSPSACGEKEAPGHPGSPVQGQAHL